MAINFIFPSTLGKLIHKPPYRVQVAYNANWMEAERYSPDDVPVDETLRSKAAGRGSDAAVEFCFKLSDGADFFFGIRCEAGLSETEIVRFISRGLAAGRSDEWVGFDEFLQRVETAGSLELGSLCKKMKNLEIGIVDYWRRGDVVEVWNEKSSSLPSVEQLRAMLERYPSLEKNTIKFVCLESNFLTPLHHWFGVEISSDDNGEHRLDISLAHRRLVENLSPTLRSIGDLIVSEEASSPAFLTLD